MGSQTSHKLVGVYGIVRGLLALLIGATMTVLGQLLGSIPLSGAGAAGGLATIIGLLYVLASLAVLASSVGLFLAKDWAPMTTTIGFGVLLLLTLYSFASGGGGTLGIVFIVLDGASVAVGALAWDAIPIGEGTSGRQAPT